MATNALDRATWSALQRVLAPTQKNAWPSLALLLVDLAILPCAAALSLAGRPPATVLAVPLLAVALFHLYLLHHECVHRSVFAEDRLNRALGHLLGFVLLYPFLPRRRMHLLHHGWAGHPEHDPTNQRAITRFGQLSRPMLACCDLLWRCWFPFLALNERLALWRAAYREPARSHRAAREERAATLLYAMGYALALALAAELGLLPLLYRLFIPALLLNLCLEEVTNLPHHAQAALVERRLRLWEQGHVTHSCRSLPVWSSVVLLHFNLHTAHHLFPNLPWFLLPRAERLLAARAPAGGQTADELRWNIRARTLAFQSVFQAYFRRASPRTPN